jgi:hypothetical protein
VSRENVEIVNRINTTADLDLVQLLRDPDLAEAMTAAIAPFLHSDFECVRHGLPGGKPYSGIDGFQGWWEDWLAPWVEYRTKINELIDCGERVLTLQQFLALLLGVGAASGQAEHAAQGLATGAEDERSERRRSHPPDVGRRSFHRCCFLGRGVLGQRLEQRSHR